MSTFTVTHPSKTVVMGSVSDAQDGMSFLCLPLTSIVGTEVSQEMIPFWDMVKTNIRPLDIIDFLQIEKLTDIEKAKVFFLMQYGKMNINEAVDAFGSVTLYKGTLLSAATVRFNHTYIERMPNSVKPYIAYDKYASDMKNSKTLIEFKFKDVVYTCMNVKKFL